MFNLIHVQPEVVSKDLSPSKKEMSSIYSTVKSKVEEDPELSKLCIPLTKINNKVLSKYLKMKETVAARKIPHPGVMMRAESYVGEFSDIHSFI